MKRFLTYFGVIIVFAGASVMFFELLRSGWRAFGESGFPGLLWDGVVLHKIGELMIIIPLGWIAAGSVPLSQSFLERLQKYALWMAPLGGLLNLAAWFKLNELVPWHVWCLILLGMGLITPIFTHFVILMAGKKKAELSRSLST